MGLLDSKLMFSLTRDRPGCGGHMTHMIRLMTLAVFLAAFQLPDLYAQDRSDESSEEVEESEEAYRRRMELEDARNRNSYSNTTFSSQAEEEKIDKLPMESRENIRDQMTQVIIDNGQWEPRDALEEYPYEPTEAAEGDPVLREQEEEAWAEQVDKYHKREAAAFGATRGPMPGDGSQQAGAGSAGSGQQEGEGGGGQAGGQGSSSGSSGAPGTYEPYDPNRSESEDAVSTAGVSESALDFLRGKQGQSNGGSGAGSPPPSGQTTGDMAQGQPGGEAGQTSAANAGQQGPGQEESSADFAASENGNEASSNQEQTDEKLAEQTDETPDGSLPISELDQLQGMTAQAQADAGVSAAAESSTNMAQDTAQEMAQDAAPETAQDTTQVMAEDAAKEIVLITPGTVAIRDLDKLEGVEEKEPEDPDP
jgi:hypothetical protein